MKVYLIGCKDKTPYIYNIASWGIVHKVGKNGIIVESTNAFFKKKDAKKWIEDFGHEFLEVKTFEFKK